MPCCGQKASLSPRPTSLWKALSIKKYAVALTAGVWQEGSWQILGTCTALAPGQPSEARGWVFGNWFLLQAVLGKHQVNIPSKAGWEALKKGAAGKTG